MQGPIHAISGTAGGLGLAAIPGLFGTPLTVPQQITIGVLVTGAALLPDMDHPKSTAAAVNGRGLAQGMHGLATVVYRRTATPADLRRRDHGHRTLSHTAAFALATGLGTWALTWVGGRLAFALVILGLAATAHRALLGSAKLRGPEPIIVPLAVAGAAYWFLPELLPGDTNAARGLVLGAAVTAGCLIHLAGDYPTNSGIPLAWPLRIGGTRWHRFRLPAGRALNTGGAAELPIGLVLLGLSVLRLCTLFA